MHGRHGAGRVANERVEIRGYGADAKTWRMESECAEKGHGICELACSTACVRAYVRVLACLPFLIALSCMAWLGFALYR